MERRIRFAFVILSLGLLAGCNSEKKAQLPNPASVNCVEKGGRLAIAKRGDDGEYGVCIFEDNRQCEEWALLRGACPIGGLKVTGYITPEGTYCAIQGGKVLDNERVCELKNGQRCLTKNLFNGQCSADK